MPKNFSVTHEKYILKGLTINLCAINFYLRTRVIIKYIIYSHNPYDLKKHIEKLLGRINKLEHIQQFLLKNIFDMTKIINEVCTRDTEKSIIHK